MILYILYINRYLKLNILLILLYYISNISYNLIYSIY